MSLTRRAFLVGGAAVVAGAGAGTLAGCTDGSDPGSLETPAAPEPGLGTWEAVRREFGLDPALAHFAAFVLASHPAIVRAAIDRWREALDADAATVVTDEGVHDEAVREAAARYLHVAPQEIALTDSTTMGLALTYHGLDLRPGDHVLTTTHDFYSTHEALRLTAVRTGAEVEQVALYEDPATASAAEMVSRLEAAVRPATRVVALTWVHSSTGVKIPVRQIAEALAEINADRDPDRRAMLCLDGVHGLGVESERPLDLGCDVFMSGTHKWLFGPRGTGLVWARREAGEAITATIPPFTAPAFGNWLTGADHPSPFGLGNTAGGYQAFEHRWAMVEAFEFHEAVGVDRVAARTRDLATRLKEGLAELPAVRLVTPLDPALSSGIVCCALSGAQPGDVLQRLRSEHGIVASVTPYRDQYLRFGPSIVTTPEQVDAAVEAVAFLT